MKVTPVPSVSNSPWFGTVLVSNVSAAVRRADVHKEESEDAEQAAGSMYLV